MIVNPANLLPKISDGAELSIYEKSVRKKLLAERMEVGGIALGDVAYPTLKKICGDGGFRDLQIFWFASRNQQELKSHDWQVLSKR